MLFVFGLFVSSSISNELTDELSQFTESERLLWAHGLRLPGEAIERSGLAELFPSRRNAASPSWGRRFEFSNTR
jgi:hypothetical protein